jgi:hypothetical protein
LKTEATLPANALVVASTATPGRVALAAAGAHESSIIGVSLDSASASGTSVRVVRDQGSTVSVKNDGTSAIQAGDAVGLSKTVAGNIRRLTTGVMVGRALSAAPAALNAPLTISLLASTTAREPLATATLVNGWTNQGGGFGPTGFCRDPLNVVRLAGVARAGTTAPGTVLFNLPAGYRPGTDLLVPAATEQGVAQIVIAATGDVKLVGGTVGAYISFDGITFPIP